MIKPNSVAMLGINSQMWRGMWGKESIYGWKPDCGRIFLRWTLKNKVANGWVEKWENKRLRQTCRVVGGGRANNGDDIAKARELLNLPFLNFESQLAPVPYRRAQKWAPHHMSIKSSSQENLKKGVYVGKGLDQTLIAPCKWWAMRWWIMNRRELNHHSS